MYEDGISISGLEDGCLGYDMGERRRKRRKITAGEEEGEGERRMMMRGLHTSADGFRSILLIKFHVTIPLSLKIKINLGVGLATLPPSISRLSK
jgi:hypothetical protein